MNKVVIEKELGATPDKNEIEAVDILVIEKFASKHVLFLKAHRREGEHTPDIRVDHDVEWEIKTPTKAKKETLDNAIKAGLKQSKNLIFNLQKIPPRDFERAKSKIEGDFEKVKSWERLVFVTKDKKTLISK